MLKSFALLAFVSSAVLALDSQVSRSNSTISAAWYTGWHATYFPLSKVSWSKYTHLTYAFATTTPNVSALSLAVSDEQLIPQFVSAAHQNNVKASISIGGWTGSRWFSPHVKTAANRTAFVKTVTNLAQKYDLDGLDFDWEYPGLQGVGCNEVDPDDTNNFLAFLEELRNSTHGKDLILSAATLDTPWVDSIGTPSANISAFSKVLDHISIMNYDVSSNPAIGAGPSSALNDSCAPVGARFGSAVSAVHAWTTAGMPASQILLGVPAYGHSFVLPPDARQNYTIGTYPPYNLSLERPGDMWDGDVGLDVCGVMQGPGGTYSYWGLIDEGFLHGNGSTVNGVDMLFDDCSQTPFLYNKTAGIYVSYDNAQSFAAKGAFIQSAGLKGFAMWEAGGDFNDTLLNAILNATQNDGAISISQNATASGASNAQSSAMPSSSWRIQIANRALCYSSPLVLLGLWLPIT